MRKKTKPFWRTLCGLGTSPIYRTYSQTWYEKSLATLSYVGFFIKLNYTYDTLHITYTTKNYIYYTKIYLKYLTPQAHNPSLTIYEFWKDAWLFGSIPL